MNSEIMIPKWVWALGLLVGLLLLGIAVSPLDGQGRPLLLSPGVKAVEDYRRSLSTWDADLTTLNSQMAGLLASGQADLFSQSSQGQQILDETQNILEEIDLTPTTAAAMPARDLALQAGRSTLVAAQATLLWISAPTPANLEAARQALETARADLASLEASQWMTLR